MKRPTPSCNSIDLLRRSSLPCAMLLTLNAANAVPLDDVSQPPPTDPSAYSNPPADPAAALEALKTMPETNQGALALPNGAYGDRNTPRADNVLPPSLQTSFKIPTNGKPSPLFGAQPFKPSCASPGSTHTHPNTPTCWIATPGNRRLKPSSTAIR
jgi:hypothetical protein